MEGQSNMWGVIIGGIASLASSLMNRKKKSKVVDTTPSEFMALRPAIAKGLTEALDSKGYSGPYVAGLAEAEQNTLRDIDKASRIDWNPEELTRELNYALSLNKFNPFYDQSKNFLLGQLTGLDNLYAAYGGLTPEELEGLDVINDRAFSNNPLMQSFLTSQLLGNINPYAYVSDPELLGLEAIKNAAFNNPFNEALNQQLMSLATSNEIPQLEQLINTATRPILEKFSEDQLAQRGAFTGAGHRVQGEGSSPFAQASAKLTSGAMDAVGDVATKLTQALSAQRQQERLAALGMAQAQQNLQLQNMLSGLSALGMPREALKEAYKDMVSGQFTAAGLGDQYASNALTRALSGLDALSLPRDAYQQMLSNQYEALRAGEALQSNAFARALQGLEAASGLDKLKLTADTAKLDFLLKNLQAQSLPRVIEQAGIDAALRQYNEDQNRRLSLMQLMGSLATSKPVTMNPPNTTSGLDSFAQGLASNPKLFETGNKQ